MARRLYVKKNSNLLLPCERLEQARPRLGNQEKESVDSGWHEAMKKAWCRLWTRFVKYVTLFWSVFLTYF